MTHSVLIIKNDPQFRAAFTGAALGATDLCLAGGGVAIDLPEGIRLLGQTASDALLVDIDLPDGSGIGMIRRANKRLPKCDVMVVTVFGDERHVLLCIEASTTGYLLKGSKAWILSRKHAHYLTASARSARQLHGSCSGASCPGHTGNEQQGLLLRRNREPAWLVPPHCRDLRQTHSSEAARAQQKQGNL